MLRRFQSGLLLLLFFNPFLWGQASFLRTYDSGLAECAYTAATSGNNLAIAGTVRVQTDQTLFSVFNPNGTVRAAVGLVSGSNSGPSKMVAVGDGSFVIGGGVVNNQLIDAMVVRVNGNGGVIWAKGFATAGNDQVSDLVKVADGFVVVGVVAGPAGDDIWITKLSPAGNPIWQRFYGTPGRELPLSITETSDHGLLITAVSFQPPNNAGHGLVVKLNRSGIIVWTRDLGLSNASFFKLMFASQMADGSINVLNSAANPSNGTERIIFSHLSKDGSILASRVYSTPSAHLDLLNALKTGDNGFLLSGNVQSRKPVPANQSILGFVMKIDADGKIVWKKRATFPEGRNLLFAGYENSTGFGSVGCFTPTAGNDDLILLQVKKDGSAATSCALITDAMIGSPGVAVSGKSFTLSPITIPISVTSITVTPQTVTLQKSNRCQ